MIPSDGSLFVPAKLELKRPSNEVSVRTVPELIDYNAATNPTTLFCLQSVKGAIGANSEAGSDAASSIPVSMRLLRDSIARCQKLLQESIFNQQGVADSKNANTLGHTPVTLFMDSDVVLFIYLTALLGLGVPVLLVSTRLSLPAVKHLTSEVGSTKIICSRRLLSVIDSKMEGLSEISVLLSQSLESFLDGDSIPDDIKVGLPGHFQGDDDRNVLILHSSGTTGMPKAIPQPHKYLLGYATCHTRTEEEEIGGLNVSTLPLFHGFGMLAPMLALSIGKPFLLPPARTVATGHSTINALQIHSEARSLMTVPHILQEIIELPVDEWTAPLRRLQFVACGGGPLKEAVGATLAAAGVKILAHFGVTEIGALAPVFVPGDDYDWHYWRLRNDLDINVAAVHGDDHSPPKEGQQPNYFQLKAWPFAWKQEFVLQDWLVARDNRSAVLELRALGRKDDLIVLATGEKVMPRILETLIEDHPLVKTAVAFGEAQFEIGVLVQPVFPQQDPDELKSLIWSLLETSADKIDSHAQLSSKTSILITRPDQIIPRSDKGSVARKEVYRLFDGEIKAAYDSMEMNESHRNSIAVLSYDTLEDDLKNIVRSELGSEINNATWYKSDDLFELGLNSLQSVRIQRAIRNALCHVADKGTFPVTTISKDFVHRHPSITSMAAHLRKEDNDQNNVTDSINSYVTKYSLPIKPGHIILLTGSTGSLGSHILTHLIGLPEVKGVVCLRRFGGSEAGDGRGSIPVPGSHTGATKTRAIGADTAHRYKISEIVADMAQPRLGLSDNDYRSLCDSVTHILHCAWPMDFQRSLASFQAQFASLNNLLQFAMNARNTRPHLRIRFGFVSSISVVGRYAQAHGGCPIVPEQLMEDEDSTNPFGYGRAKLVCERILANAAMSAAGKMEVCVMRLGQVSGARCSGFWNTNEHVPTIIQVAQDMGKWPKLEGTLSWIPVDTCAAVVSDILLSKSELNFIYHVENPIRQDWSSVLSTVAAKLGFGSEVFIPFDEWCQLAASKSTSLHLGMLMDFFADDFQRMACGGVILDTANSRRQSKTLQRITPIGEEQLEKYISHWQESGFLRAQIRT